MVHRLIWERLDPAQQLKLATAMVDRGRVGDRFGKLDHAVLATHIVRFFNGQMRLSRAEERLLVKMAKNSEIVLPEAIEALGAFLVIGEDGKGPEVEELLDDEGVAAANKKRAIVNGPPRPKEISSWALLTILGIWVGLFSIMAGAVFNFDPLPMLIVTCMGVAGAMVGLMGMVVAG